ncbi:transcriptional repressor [Streptomyces sp. NPDC059153]|uniref:transcriptional repressor n=1 Tax=Streptomyces sp. NPDC059153 TaxID=3346743 RepID=UPI00368AD69F
METTMGTASSAAAPDRPRRRRAADRRPEVLAALRENKGFLSAQGLHASMMQRGIRIGLTTVYRALSAADAEGWLETVHARGGVKSYRYLPPVHEHHMRCRVCGVRRRVRLPGAGGLGRTARASLRVRGRTARCRRDGHMPRLCIKRCGLRGD